jgi:hypothetical protein
MRLYYSKMLLMFCFLLIISCVTNNGAQKNTVPSVHKSKKPSISESLAADDDLTKVSKSRGTSEFSKVLYEVFTKYLKKNKMGYLNDGYFAEGYSDDITVFLANNWTSFPTLANLMEKDKDFHGFVIRHIDATCGQKELEQIILNTKSNCPIEFKKICFEVEEATQQTINFQQNH